MVHNNAKTIEKAVKSLLSLVSELIIIDDNSTDDTINLIKQIYPNVVVYTRSINKNFAAQRNFAISKAKFDWVIFIDSDEEVMYELKKEILITLKNPSYQAYLSRRDNLVFDKFYPANSGRPILLRSNLKFEGELHENIFSVKKGMLKNPINHYDWNGVTDMMDQLNKYSTMDAEKWFNEKRSYNMFQIFLIATVMPFYTFVQH